MLGERLVASSLIAFTMSRCQRAAGVAWNEVVGFYPVTVLEGPPAQVAVGCNGFYLFSPSTVISVVKFSFLGLAFGGVHPYRFAPPTV